MKTVKHYIKDYGVFIILSFTLWSLPHTPANVLCLPLVCRKLESRSKFNQRNKIMQKQRKSVKGDQITIMSSLSIVKDLWFLLKGYR